MIKDGQAEICYIVNYQFSFLIVVLVVFGGKGREIIAVCTNEVSRAVKFVEMEKPSALDWFLATKVQVLIVCFVNQ